MCRAVVEKPWGKLQNLLWMELATDVTLIFLGNKLYVELIWGNIPFYRKYQCKKMYISSFGQNIPDTCMKIPLDNNKPIVWETTDLSFPKNVRAVKENSYYYTPSTPSIPPLPETLRPMSPIVIHDNLIF